MDLVPIYTDWTQIFETWYNWRIRFSTSVTGEWRYKVYAFDNPYWQVVGDSSMMSWDSSAEHTFTVATSTDKGYIKVAANGYNFCYANNDSIFIPLGPNVMIEGDQPRNIYNRSQYVVSMRDIPHLAANGANIIRDAMWPQYFSIEWGAGQQGEYDKRQDKAKDMDDIIESLGANNMYMILLVDAVSEFDSLQWLNENPYHRTGSGDSVLTFLTDTSKYIVWYENRMRYMLARWGYSPHLFSFEIFSELEAENYHFNYWDSIQHNAYMNWLKTVIGYCKRYNKHILFNAGAASNDAAMWPAGPQHRTQGVIDASLYGQPEIDFITDHFYCADYNYDYQRSYIKQLNMRLYHKPTLTGEMELENEVGRLYVGSYSDHSVHNTPLLHTSLWADFFSGAASPGLIWGAAYVYHDSSICYGGQDANYKPFRAFFGNEPMLYDDTRKPINNACTGTGKYDDTSHIHKAPAWDRCLCVPTWCTGSDTLNVLAGGINTTNDSLLEVFGMKTGHRMIGWVSYKLNYWYDLPRNPVDTAHAALNDNLGPDNKPNRSVCLPDRSGDSIAIPKMMEGTYSVKFYSTYPDYPLAFGGADSNGGVIDTFTIAAVRVGCDKVLKFAIPPLMGLRPNDSLAPYAPDYGFKTSWIGIEVQDTIKSNTVWSTSGAVPHDTIVVDSGAILTIQNCTIQMESYGLIKVLPGGQLIVDHATIKGQDSACHMWGGIQAVGNAGAEQYPWTQGWVQIKDSSVIEGALVGVSNWDGNLNLAHTGGAIQAINSTFLNNLQAVSFHPYHNQHALGLYPDLSTFTACDFIVDRKLKASEGSNSYLGMVFMNDVLGMDFEGCNFINRDTATAVKGHGIGIFSHNSGYYVVPQCTALSGSTCSSWKRGYFNGFERGILAEGNILTNPDFSMYIDRCDFDSNRVGVHIKARNMSSTSRCNFNVGHAGPLLDNNGSLLCYENVGIIIENAHTFRIEADSIYGKGNMYSMSNWKNLGVLVENTGSNNNTVYKNYFNGLDYGCYTVGNNYSPSNNPYRPPGTTGLRFRCNYFTNDTTDIYIDGGANAGYAPGVAVWQGDTAIPASNYFATGGSIVNYGDSIRYYFDSTPAQMKPGYLYPALVVDTFRTGATGTCPSSYDISNSYTSIGNTGSVHLSNLQSVYTSLHTSLTSDIHTYESLVAAGDTNIHHLGLLISVEGEAMSDTAAHIMRALKGLHHGSGTCGIVTDSTSMWYGKDSNNYYTLIDSVAPMLLSMGTLASQYELAGYYHFKNPLDAMHHADTALSHAKDFFKTTDSTHNSEYLHFYTLWKTIKALDSSGRSVYEMTDNEKDTLTMVGRDNGDDGEEGLINMASFSQPIPIGGLIRADPYCNPYSSGHKPGRGKDTTQNHTPPIQPVRNIRADCMLNAYPNPANNFVSFGYRVPDAGIGMVLIVTDAVGKEIKRFHIRDNSGIVQWDIRQLSPGMYIYVLKDEAGTVGMGKLVIE